MRNIVLCALLTGLFWGCYGPALALAREALKSPFKPYVAIGAAYLVWGILGGLIGMKVKGDTFSFTGPGAGWGFIAGSLGAWGALTLTVAMVAGGARTPNVVMAIVFGSAVTISALVGWWQTRQAVTASPLLWVGIVLILIGAIVTAYHTPSQHPKPKAPLASSPIV